jgi:transglutaminase superfamily protein
MKWLVFKSWLTLLFVDVTMHFRGFKALRRAVLKERVAQLRNLSRQSEEEVCHAVDLARVFYFRQVSRLEGSAAATLVLRKHGWQADLVIGAQILPHDTYAWVEIKGKIVNDQPNLLEVYQVLERC